VELLQGNHNKGDNGEYERIRGNALSEGRLEAGGGGKTEWWISKNRVVAHTFC